MMLRRACLLLGTLLVYGSLFSQDEFGNYEPLRSRGTIPEDLIRFYIKDSENKSSGSSADFIQHNTYEFGNLFASGKIIFNDPLSIYAKKVLDTLLWKQPVVRSKMRIYTLKSAVANAYTTNDGKIFITTGLYARLQNEAQLAFILSHEVIHYLNNHAYETYVFNRGVDRRKKQVNYEQKIFEDELLTKFRHSRSNEFEADKQGLLLYLQTEYTTAVIDSVFKMLDYSDLPVQNIPFDRSFFEGPYFHLREEAWLKPGEVEKVVVDAEFKESKSTHPNSKSRKAQIQGVLDKAMLESGIKKFYLFPENDFTRMKNIALFELCNVYYLDHNYVDAIYNSWLLLKDFPGNLYLRKTIARCLAGLLSENSYRMGLHDHNIKRGYISQLAHLIRFSDRDELERMALIFTWNTYRNYKDDNDLKVLLNKFFSFIDEKDPAYFYTRAQADSKLAGLKTQADTGAVLLSGFPEVLRRCAFADLLDNSDFADALHKAQTGQKPFELASVRLESNRMFVIPLVYIIDSLAGRKNYSDPQKVIAGYGSQVKELGESKNMQLTFLSTYDLKPGDIERYNDYSLLSDWVAVNGERDIQNFIDWNGMQTLSLKYKSKFICLSGVYFYKNSIGTKLKRWAVFTLLLPPAAGIIPGSVQLFTSNYSAYYSTVIYDIETGKIVSRTYDMNYNNFKPRTKKKNFWHTLRPWYEENVLQKVKK